LTAGKSGLWSAKSIAGPVHAGVVPGTQRIDVLIVPERVVLLEIGASQRPDFPAVGPIVVAEK